MERLFEALSEPLPGARWQGLFKRHWPAYKRWFLSEGERARPTYLSSLRAFKAHMPELVPTYEQLVELAGGGDVAARFLSCYCPPAYLSGCSQAVWQGPQPLLVRNYDYHPQLFEGVILHTTWHGRRVISTSDCLWGALDGINEAGLAVSLTFGGRRVVGEGFGVPLILRYVLEFCSDATEAIDALCRIPSHMAYNITVLDRAGRFYTVYLGPDRPARAREVPIATNHQEQVDWPQHARATATLERERFLYFRLRESDEPQRLVQAFLRSPIYSTAYERGFGTLYTVALYPAEGRLDYLWPNGHWPQALNAFDESRRLVRFPSQHQPDVMLH